MELENVDQLRVKYPKNADRTDDEIADRYLKMINDKRDKLENLGPVNYFKFIEIVNPQSKDANVKNYMATLSPDDAKAKSEGEHAFDVFQKLKDERNLQMDFSDFAKDFAPKFGTGRSRNLKRNYTTEEIANITGTATEDDDFTTVKGRAIGSLAMDEKNLAQAIRNEASKYFGEDVEVRIGPYTNELEVYNPKQKKFQLVNKPGIDAGDFASLSGDLGVAIAEIIGYTIGGPVSILSGAGFATAADMGRMYIGHEYFGINPELKGTSGLDTFGNYLREGAMTGAISAISGSLFSLPGMVPGVKKIAKKLFKKEEVKEVDLEDFKDQIKDTKELSDRMNKKIADNKLRGEIKFNLGQVTNDPELLAYAHAYEKHSKYGVKGSFHKMRQSNAIANKELFELFRDGFVSDNLVGKDPVGYDTILKKIKTKAVQLNNEQRKPFIDALQKSENDLTEEVIKFPDGQLKEGGETIKSAITEFRDLRLNEINNKYKKLMDGTDTDSQGLALRKLKLDEVKDNKGKVIRNEYKFLTDAVNEMEARAKDTLKKNYSSVKSFFELPKKGEEITFRKLHNTRSDLLKDKRNLLSKQTSDEKSLSETQIDRLISAINRQMDSSLGGDDPMLKMYRKIDNETSQFYDNYNRFIGQVVRKDGGRLKIGDEDIFRSTFKTGPSQQSRINDVFDVLKTDSEAFDLYKNNILEFYMRKVDPQNIGKIDLNKHRKFIVDHKYGLEKFFGKDGYKDITKVGNLQQKIKDLNLKNIEIEKKLKATTAGELENKKPELIFDYAFKPSKFGGKTPSTLRDIMKIIKDDEITKNEFKTLVSERLMLESTNPMDFSFNAKNFNEFLQENRENLKIVFADDKQYLDNLKDFNKVLAILDRSTTDEPPKRFQSALRDLIRAKVGMFTVAGRTMTAGLKISEDMLNRKMAQIIQNPDELVQLLELADKPKSFLQTKKGKIMVRTLFGSIPAMQQFDVTPDLEDVKSKDVNKTVPITPDVTITPTSQAPSTTPDVNMFAMEQAPRPSEPAPVTPPPVEQPQPAGIAALPTDRGQTYAGLFPNDPSGQMIAQRSNQNART